ncbi:hypothetical protein Thiosp_03659 [Thiorhodovibrio litoralis]|nr:hypothetical protein Thiosp_03659 [Thiorhodovibrio litoralis]
MPESLSTPNEATLDQRDQITAAMLREVFRETDESGYGNRGAGAWTYNGETDPAIPPICPSVDCTGQVRAKV